MANICKISTYLHCTLCLAELPPDLPPNEYQSIEVGMLAEGTGLQVWCKRHECNVFTVNLNGDKWTWDASIDLGVASQGGEQG